MIEFPLMGQGAKIPPAERPARRKLVWLGGLLATMWISAVVNPAEADSRVSTPYPGIEFRAEVRYRPRLIRFFLLKIDLTNRNLVCEVAVATDPKRPEFGKAVLQDPARLAQQYRLLAAVNANPFGLVNTGGRENAAASPVLSEGKAQVTICGWAKIRNATLSPPNPRFWSFWITPDGTPQVGNPASPPEALVAVSGFGPLILEGKIVAAGGGPLDRRTAVGIDQRRTTLFLLVVDGRQPGWSEGVTYGEVADLLLEAGAHWAIQLDGGSSSVMLLRSPTGEMQVVNRPPDLAGVRPVPVLLGFRHAP